MTSTITLLGISDDDQRTLNLLLTQLEQKLQRNRLRQAYYDMKRVTRLVGSVIPPQYWGLGIVLGWSGKAVDVLSRRTNLDGFVWPEGKLDDIGFREVWENNNLGSEVSQAGISSLIHSTAFVVNTRGGEGEPDALVHFRDALNATGEWNARTRRLDNLLSVNARGDDDRITALALYLDGRTIVAEKDASGWSVDVQEHDWGVPAEPLPYKPRLGRPFGSSRISREVMNLQDQATRALIRLEAHSDIYAIPDLWLLGADESIFKNADGTTKAAWQVVMGRIKGVPDDEDAAQPRADVKAIPASSPEPHLAALNAYAKMFARATSLPDTAVAITDMANPTSAEAYDASQHELIAEAEGATDDWAPYLRRATVRALAMQNGIGIDAVPSAWKTIDTKWRDPRYLSRAAQADAGTKQLQAVPWLAETEVGLELLGLSEQQISRAWADRRRAQAQQRTTMLAAAAQAARQARSAPEGTGGDAG
ncbi:phage portal protein [Micromonospora taraxaci]|uniref:phage portal protein n=1 Tax=Micromonospora taraxaci TaxID=1316803 RepID=UPI0033ADE5EB